jgi:26S proteasome regulatory subunit N5
MQPGPALRTSAHQQAADMSSTSTLLSLTARLCYQAKDYDQLNTQLTLLSKKHGQLKEAVVRMVDESMTWLPELKEQKDKGEFKSGKDRWLELINTLRDITEGKVRQLPVPFFSCWSSKLTRRSTWSWQGQG